MMSFCQPKWICLYVVLLPSTSDSKHLQKQIVGSLATCSSQMESHFVPFTKKDINDYLVIFLSFSLCISLILLRLEQHIEQIAYVFVWSETFRCSSALPPFTPVQVC